MEAVLKLGYARVSTDDQSLEVQLEQLKAAGCMRIFQEKISGKGKDRTWLNALLDHLEHKCPQCHGFDDYCADVAPCETCAGQGRRYPEIVVVTKLDRLARNTRDLLEIVDRIGKAGAGLVSLGEPWADTTSPAGRMVMTVLAGVAEFERARILERTSEGRALAKRNGVHLGRPESLSKEQQRAAMKMLRDSTVREVARVMRVSQSTIRRLALTGGTGSYQVRVKT
jgi:DNA invertase Pin-like site-specific DNA recombinase